MKDFELNDEQKAALDMLHDFRRSPRIAAGLFGAAGTGKSTVLTHFLKQVPQGIKVLMTAPTHKATQVLYDMAEAHGYYGAECRTLQSALAMTPLRKGGDVEFLQQGNARDICPAKDHDIVVVDECSMIGKDLYSSLVETAKQHRFKIIFTGDPYQLPPVNEEMLNGGKSQTFNVKPRAVLETVERCGGDLLKIVTETRRKVGGVAPPLPIQSDEVKWTKSKKKFFDSLLENIDDSVYIAWTNASVHWVNEWLHDQIHGEGTPLFIPGEKVIGNYTNNFWRAQQQFIVGEVEEDFVDGWPVYAMTLAYDHAFMNDDEVIVKSTDLLRDRNGYPIRFSVIKPEARKAFKTEIAERAEEARSHPYKSPQWRSAWSRFYAFKNQYVDVRHPFAMTVHGSQGSTYDKVFVAQKNISRCRDLKLRSKLQYVAYSRASEFLMIC